MEQNIVNHSALATLKSVLLQKYPDDIDQIILFGSQVNGTARKYSDYDLLLIVKHPYDWRFENDIYDMCPDINIDYDIITDIKVISHQELQTLRGKQPFIQDALHHGMRL